LVAWKKRKAGTLLRPFRWERHFCLSLLAIRNYTRSNSDNGDDDGQGHQFVINTAGHSYLYALDRANNHIDADDLYIHELSPQPGLPLKRRPGDERRSDRRHHRPPGNRLSHHRVAESRWYSGNRSPQLAAGDYRTIGRVGLRTEHEIAAIGQSGDDQ